MNSGVMNVKKNTNKYRHFVLVKANFYGKIIHL